MIRGTDEKCVICERLLQEGIENGDIITTAGAIIKANKIPLFNAIIRSLSRRKRLAGFLRRMVYRLRDEIQWQRIKPRH